MSGALAWGLSVDVLYIDFSNAFDKVTQNKLLKLNAEDGKLFATLDDTINRHKSIKDNEDEISKHCHTWTMVLNTKKCAVIHYGKNTI